MYIYVCIMYNMYYSSHSIYRKLVSKQDHYNSTTCKTYRMSYSHCTPNYFENCLLFFKYNITFYT